MRNRLFNPHKYSSQWEAKINEFTRLLVNKEHRKLTEMTVAHSWVHDLFLIMQFFASCLLFGRETQVLVDRDEDTLDIPSGKMQD